LSRHLLAIGALLGDFTELPSSLGGGLLNLHAT
jgi:hypothetical protein